MLKMKIDPLVYSFPKKRTRIKNSNHPFKCCVPPSPQSYETSVLVSVVRFCICGGPPRLDNECCMKRGEKCGYESAR